jgi:UDP-N-acetylglucosamine--N-acetylmuramyl-(pentapeptide) pyrophosphoryl-undecaprenol N-acetylglucosamine transferase
VIGLGGFASVPYVLAARRERIPVLLLEQNAVTGRANRWLSRGCPICLTFAESAARLPGSAQWEVTGNPLRRSLIDRARIRRAEPESRQKPRTLLVLGGSQGSRQVNESVLNAVSQLFTELAGWRVVHQTGPDGEALARTTYSRLGIEHLVQPLFAEPAALYESATLAIGRAGATTLTELAAFGVPAVLIPYPNAADNHQVLNARPFVAAGAALSVECPSTGMAAVDLVDVLRPLLEDPARLRAMSAAMAGLANLDATSRVVDRLTDAVSNRF